MILPKFRRRREGTELDWHTANIGLWAHVYGTVGSVSISLPHMLVAANFDRMQERLSWRYWLSIGSFRLEVVWRQRQVDR